MNANWQVATMDTIFSDVKPPLLRQRCWLKLVGGTLELTFDIGSPPAMIGKRDGTGHYHVVVPGSGGGTLHRFADDKVLEGSWNMNGQHGFWRVVFSASSMHDAQVLPMLPPPARRKASVRARKPVKVRPRRVAA